MKDKRNFTRGRDIISAILLIVIGGVLLINPDLGSAAVTAIFGWGLVAVGGLGLVICIATWPVCSWPELGISLLGAAMGIYLLFHPLSLASVLGVGLGLVVGIRSIGSVMNAMDLKRRGWNWIPGMVLAVLGMILAMVLILSPMSTSRIVMRLCGAGMIVWGILRLLIHIGPTQEPENPDIIDADL